MTNLKDFRFLLAVLGLALLAGCQGVVATHPLPAARLSEAEQAHLAGTWVMRVGEGAVYTVGFACDGKARVAGTDWDGRRFTLQQDELVFSRGAHADEDTGFLSLGAGSGQKSQGYAFLRYRFLSARDLVLWVPDPAPFNAAVKAGKLKGTADQRRIEITSKPEALLEFVDDPANGTLFDYRNPVLLRKVAGPEGDKLARDCAGK